MLIKLFNFYFIRLFKILNKSLNRSYEKILSEDVEDHEKIAEKILYSLPTY